MKNRAPVNDALRKKIAALPAEKARERNSRIGSIGARARISHATNATASSAPATSAPTTSGLPQPADTGGQRARRRRRREQPQSGGEQASPPEAVAQG